MKKLLLCVLVSILAINFVVMGVTIVCVLQDNVLFQVDIYNRFSKDKVSEEELIEYYKNQEEQMQSVKDTNPEKYNEDYPIYGMFASVLPLIKMRPVVSMYILSIILGIIFGLIIYLIVIENKKGKEAVISFILCLVLTVILFYGLKIMSNALYTNIPYIQFDDFEWYGLVITYTTTFGIIYGLNYIYNKFITKKMNKELNK